ncbi:uncharacterized protein LOC130447342 isoform X1 [Diorhabda sublineata]|uniref:uncharacterized protein LOC130447342 isoform X1 n=1 Tax=Diorhabda sublineata TaxID=1163346 RepID=UPI0024E09BDC|nr:uncharacterized protein LOC130447342 isoform X1 [Diorhabda sublineata]
MTSRGYYNEETPFLYNTGDEPAETDGMECLQLRQSTGPFHYLISEQAKSLVALQELQHEVGALLEFRDLVIETFPNLRSKLASSTPATMTSHHHSNIPVSIRPGDWTPGVRVRKKIGSKEERKKVGDTAVQDSGFSTETSSKETHSASSTALANSSAAGVIEPDDIEDELWNLLDIIHRKGTRLKDEAELLQGAIRNRSDRRTDGDSFNRVLFSSCPSSSSDVRKLRQERDLLLDRLAEMEAEVLAGRVHTCRLQEDLENLMSAKQDLEEQLKAVIDQRGEVNSRIHDLHLQFVTKNGTGGSTQTPESEKFLRDSSTSTVANCSQRTNRKSVGVRHIDLVFSDENMPKVAVPDTEKIAAILKERDPLVLQKHLLTTTVRNQVLREQLDTVTSIEEGLRDRLNRFREENEDLKFQLEDRTIELEGTRARIRLLEDLRKPSNKTSSPDIIPALDSTPPARPQSRTEISTASMKAMCPLIMNSMKNLNLQSENFGSPESVRDRSSEKDKKDIGKTKRPSKIPLKSYTAPKPPGGKHSPAPSSTRYRNGDSPCRPHSAQSWTKTKSEANSLNSKSNSLSKSRNGSLVTTKDSLSGKLRSSDSFQKLNGSATNTFGRNVQKKSSSVSAANKKENNTQSDKIPDSNLAKERSPSPWILSSYNSDPDITLDRELETAYPDSLDRNDCFRCPAAGPDPLLNGGDEFYDSIDVNVASSMFHNGGEDMAECDSLEGQLLSDFLEKN